MQRVTRSGLAVAEVLADFVETEALPGTGVDADGLLGGLRRHRAATSRRATARCWTSATGCRRSIDDWHRANGAPSDMAAYRGFLREIGYLVDEGPDFAVETAGVDPEIGAISGPQLVVPLSNARFALNAANARWGSLYDALYGTNAIPENSGRERGERYNPVRGADGHRLGARRSSNDAVPLRGTGWAAARGFSVRGGALAVTLAPGHDHADTAGAVRGLPRRRRGAGARSCCATTGSASGS